MTGRARSARPTPEYYRWTQWIFLLLFRRGLAYQAFGQQWWCAQCQTILANEQVEDGRCWRCDSVVRRKSLQQWFFRITDYADRLLADLDGLAWPERIKAAQRNWIGRSEGAEVVFTVESAGRTHTIPVFTTRPDTLFGVSFLALAPEHPLVHDLTTEAQHAAVSEYVAAAESRTEIDRASGGSDKFGVFTGVYARHPLSGAPIPVWVADYVLPGYGSGAIMGVPAHDERDHAFAKQYGLPIVTVVSPMGALTGVPDGEADNPPACYTEPGLLVNSGPYSGLSSVAASERMMVDLAAAEAGGPSISYRMRDWLISRQRYWGAPIPIIHCPTCGSVPVPEEDLPVRLPDVAMMPATGLPTDRRRPFTAGSRGQVAAHDLPDAAARPNARPTRWMASPVPHGTSCALPIPTMITARLIPTRCSAGCRLTLTWAARSMPLSI